MEVSFEYRPEKGFFTTVPGKPEIRIRDPTRSDDNGYSPTDYLLIGMGGCTSADVVTILPKMRVAYKSFSTSVEAERNEHHPKTLKYVNIKYQFTGSPDPEKVKKCINLSLTKYCHISILAHRGGADVRYSIIIDGKTVCDRLKPEEPGRIADLES